MHEKRLVHSAVPEGEAEFCIYPDGSLEALVTLKKGNCFLDRILFWNVGYRGAFSQGEPFSLLVLDAFENSFWNRHRT